MQWILKKCVGAVSSADNGHIAAGGALDQQRLTSDKARRGSGSLFSTRSEEHRALLLNSGASGGYCSI